jgi:N-acetyl-gamma-glutamyl-phosphate reductase
MSRGILATCYARPAAGAELSTERLLDELTKTYRDEPFVVVTAESPSTKDAQGSNVAFVTARFDARTNHVVVLCALDNLTKGASGGAVQAANVALGIEETAGLPRVGLSP